MKKNLLYLAGFLIAFAGIFSGCDEDDPSYSNLLADTQELLINFDETTEGMFRVIQGNGNYKVTSSNEEVATATVEGNTIKVTALKAGSTSLTITDWAKMSTSVQVIVDQLTDLVLVTTSTTMYPEETKTVDVYTGNRGYKVTVDNSSVAKASVDETGKIQITSLAPGTAKVTVTDRQNKQAELTVKVIKHLVIDNPDPIECLVIGEPVTIKILDGNGKYTCINNGSASYLKCEMSEDGTEVVIQGIKRNRFNKTVTIKDNEGQSVNISIIYIDNPYMETEGYFTFLKTSSSYQGLAIPKLGKIVYSEDFNMTQIISKSSTSATTGGFAIEFTGDMTVGAKSNATLYKLAKGAIAKDKPYEATDCRIDQVKNGYYWVSFMEPNCTLRSYIVVKNDN